MSQSPLRACPYQIAPTISRQALNFRHTHTRISHRPTDSPNISFRLTTLLPLSIIDKSIHPRLTPSFTTYAGHHMSFRTMCKSANIAPLCISPLLFTPHRFHQQVIVSHMGSEAMREDGNVQQGIRFDSFSYGHSKSTESLTTAFSCGARNVDDKRHAGCASAACPCWAARWTEVLKQDYAL